jgi:predicted PurR-regulated permease PerM
LLTLAIISLYNFFLKRFNFHKAIAIILSILTYTLVFWLILVLIQSNINQIISLTPTYQERFSELLVKLALPETLNLSRFIENLDLQTIFTSIISSVTSVI